MTMLDTIEENEPRARTSAISSLSIRTKLAIIVALGFFLTFAVTFVLVTLENKAFGREVQEKNDLIVARLLVGQMQSAVELKDKASLAQILESAVEGNTVLEMVNVTDLSGERLAGVGEAEDVAAQLDASIAEATETKLPQPRQIGDLFLLSYPVMASDGVNLAGIASFAWDTGVMVRAQEAQVYRILLLGALVALAGLSVIVFAVSRLVTTPITELTKSMTSVAEQDYTPEIKGTSRGDEIGSMASKLEVFRDELAKEEEERKERRAETALRQKLFQELGHQMSLLAEGRTNCEVDVDHFVGLDDDHKKICGSFNEVVGNLRRMLSTVMSTSENVRTSALEISQTAEEQSRRSESQAATLEESAAAIEDLNASVQKTADLAADANMRILENKKLAANGGEVVGRTVKAMRDIEQSSQQITAIIGVIDDIAFQTNLLALNAGVEAARAGEAGRGFAVVASEVRALAQRASESANEIKELILRSGGHVSEGSDLASQAGAALSEIIGGVNHLSDLVGLIAHGSSEQATNLSEIKESVSQLDRETQKNAAIIEESSAASQSLSNEAERMTDVIKQFTFDPGAEDQMQDSTDEDLAGPKNWSEEIDEVVSNETKPALPAAALVPQGGGQKRAATNSIDEGWEEF